MMKNLVLLTCILSAPSLAATEFPQFFVGAKGGYQWALDDQYSHSNPESTIFGVYGGLQFTPSWRWDIGYQYHDELKADATSVNVKTWLIESALRYDWYLQDNLSLYGRLGAAYWEMDKAHSSDKTDANGFSPLGEVGVSYNFNSSLQLSGGYQYIDSIGQSNTGKYDSHGVLVGVTYMFGRETQSTRVETASNAPIDDTRTNVKEAIAVKASPQTQGFTPKTTSRLSGIGIDSIEPSHGFVEQLTKVVPVLNTYPQGQAVVVGHTDSTGSTAYNQKLSERRAQAVVNKLIELGVTPAQLEWRGEGESRPISDNNTVEGRAKNRRVEITIPNF